VKLGTIEAMILFDADKIDGLGAIGLARSFAMVGKYGDLLYEKFDRDSVEEYMRETDKKHAPNIEFQIKYKSMCEQLYTEHAKNMAEERIKFMELFFNQLNSEVNER
jgi:uncharacterized protein